MKDKDELKRPTICSHQEAERPTPSSELITHHHHHHPPKTANVLLVAVLRNIGPPSRRTRDKNTQCLAAGRDITQGCWKPPQDLRASRPVWFARQSLHLPLTEVERGGGALGGVEAVMTMAARRNIFNRRFYQ